jgi:voltage-gated potassium channel
LTDQGGSAAGPTGLQPARSPWRARLYRVIYEADTDAGKSFDVALIAVILLSVAAVMLESIRGLAVRYGPELRVFEWGVTAVFTIEYVLRLICVRNPLRYVRSFFGVVDLIALLPSYLSILIPGAQTLLIVRFLRLLRIFRVFKLASYLREASLLQEALVASRRKIAVFFMAVLTLVVILGAIMYLIEGEGNGFTSIPQSIYWTIVTLTTVGFGDITPKTPLGQAVASVVMLIGYSIIAVPTGLVTAEIARAASRPTPATCPGCGRTGHEPDARFCRHCGSGL